VIKKDFSWLRSTYVWVGLGAGALVVLPWHIHESMQAGSTFWDSYLFHQVLSRFGSDILGGSTTSVTYLTYLATFALPWTLLFLIGGSTSLLFFYKNNKDDFKNQLILFVYVFCLLAIYFVAQTKIVYYLTPVYPFIAIFGGLVGSTIFGTLHKKKNEYMFYTISVLITIGALVYTTYIGFHAQADFLTDSHAVTEEMQIGTRLASEPLTQTIYTLDYPNNQTIIYYSNGRTPAAIPQQAVLSGPLDIILFKKRYDNGPLPDILRTHSTVEYNGNVLMLLHYTP
jgi:hypothetical protein